MSILLLLNLHHLLVVATTANQGIQPVDGEVVYFQMTACGMVSSVVMRAHAALVPTLHHGSV